MRGDCLLSLRGNASANALSFMAAVEMGGEERGEVKNVDWVREWRKKLRVGRTTLFTLVIIREKFKSLP